jgi:hypothetical protein
VFAFNVAKLSLARAIGRAADSFPEALRAPKRRHYSRYPKAYLGNYIGSEIISSLIERAETI